MSASVAPSVLALGTVKLGRTGGLKYPRPHELPSDAEVDALLEAALAMGVTLFDTAPAYGSSEERLRPFLSKHRDEVLISTKAGEEFGADGSSHDFTAAAIRSSCERSLSRLGCEKIDFLLLHSDGGDAAILDESGAVDALLDLQRVGKVDRVGISAKTDYGVRRGAELLDVVMAPLSSAAPELEPALRAAHEAGAHCMAIKSLASGHLAETQDPAVAVERSLKFVLQREFIDTVVLGTTNPEHLSAAMSVARRLRNGRPK
jgi:aryl-alcohol dehydrogenase-like predicted oxidoreductase